MDEDILGFTNVGDWSNELSILISNNSKEMKKKDLKSGMCIKLRNGDTLLCIGEAETDNYGRDICLISNGDFAVLSGYSEGLECKSNSDFDMDMVFYDKVNCNTFEFGTQPLIWQRNDKKDQVKYIICEMQNIIDEIQEDIKQKLESINKLKQELK